VDLDAFTAVNKPQWDRLESLGRQRRLTGAEADELVRLYQSTATDLSAIRSSAPDPTTISQLSQVLGRARSRIAGAHEPSLRDVARFVVVSLPAALYRLRWWTVAVIVASVAVAMVSGVWVATHPEVLAMMGTPSEQKAYVDHAFAEYYNPGAGFAGQVWTNNAWLAAQCVGLGITGIWPVMVLVNNSVNVGAMGGLMAAHGHLSIFLQLISPHGLLELTSLFVAGAAGLRIFWSWIDPGPRPRSQALAEEGRSLITVALGLVGTLAVSGLIEGFVTGSALPWVAKITTGVLALAGFWTYTLVLGRRAVAHGETGDLEADLAGDVLPVVG
jgi:uncharacterized membrane protein SpoIIM required for sporulation